MLRSFTIDFSIAFLGEFSKDEAHVRQRYGDVPNQSDSGVFSVRISLVGVSSRDGLIKILPLLHS